ncbi:hypothetical protein OOK36_20830 [Streptomyces sp. NBC_00365]|uniref:hypothetical protein n=1 Tax=Streptomyces sp. NBC_00365 TaxID=2975726 RepID=UPI00225741A0|nr:hypothetical protein [Streptomyces sp. NBC_00365]MCX5091293.1 hypothetical protein [Streptomyces sp. NBC_00365]
MSRNVARVIQDTELEKDRARYGLLAVVVSILAISGVAIFGVWRLDGDKAVIVGVLTAAFTAVSSMTTAYLGIKAVSNTAQSMAHGAPRRTPTPPETPTQPTEPPTPTPPAPRAP